jgi:hypothetical protein
MPGLSTRNRERKLRSHHCEQSLRGHFSFGARLPLLQYGQMGAFAKSRRYYRRLKERSDR